jgi:hypothetical protein
VNRMLAPVYLHVIFPWTVSSHLVQCELPHAKSLNGNNCVISIREPIHIQVYPVLITDGIYVTFNFVSLPFKESKVCIVYKSGEPNSVKSKIRQCDMG